MTTDQSKTLVQVYQQEREILIDTSTPSDVGCRLTLTKLVWATAVRRLGLDEDKGSLGLALTGRLLALADCLALARNFPFTLALADTSEVAFTSLGLFSPKSGGRGRGS